MPSIAEKIAKVQKKLDDAKKARSFEWKPAPWLVEATERANAEAAKTEPASTEPPRCALCQSMLPKRARYCPHCGEPVDGGAQVGDVEK